MTDPIMLTFEAHRPLNANHRLHWRDKARRSAEIRHRAYLAWHQAGRPQLERAHCLAVFQFRDARRRDANNLAPTTKAAIDGAVSGPAGTVSLRGILPDDDTTHLLGPDLRIGVPDRTLRPGWVRITLEFTPLEVLA